MRVSATTLRAMEAEGPAGDRLLRDLEASRRRFQAYMRRLIEKYDQPFEEDALVQMATLTYDTPEDSEVDAALDKEDLFACALKPAVPGSPLENELRRKYLTQVDALLQDAEYVKGVEKRDGKDTLMAPVLSLTSSVTPAPGCQDRISADSLSDPEAFVSSSKELGPSHPCPADMTIAPRNISLSLLSTSSDSYLNSQSFEADDICNVTISDLYAGMLHSMSRLLSSKPSCIISTKTYISQNWNPRRTLLRRSRVQRSSSRRSAPSSEVRVLGNCENMLHMARHKTGLKLEKAFLEGSKLQIHKSSPAWKKFQVAPRKHPSWTYLDFDTVCHLDWEDRLKALKWLISPVKIVSRPRMLQGQAESWYREIDIRFDKLHRECCLTSRKKPRLSGPPRSWAVGVHRGGSKSPGSSQGLETHRPREKKRLSEAFQDLGKVPVRSGRHPPKSKPSSSLSEDSSTWSPGHFGQTPGLFLQGRNSGPIRKAVLPSTAISAQQMGPWDCGRSRYDEIKEEFKKLYQKYCLMSPQQTKAPLRVSVSPRKASQAEGVLGTLSLDSAFQGSQKLSPSPQWCIESPRDSPGTQGHMPLGTVSVVRRNPQFPVKRRRLSYRVCGHQADSRDSSGSAVCLFRDRLRRLPDGGTGRCELLTVFHKCQVLGLADPTVAPDSTAPSCSSSD
ncbi:Holliday junction recognition protein [Nannospalax galili]|uniref:Holliday junction recognition protein n=1 Tax=Nannospalax galili TaxID=1026970 RepID=UPI00111C0337|nr:Holliday junction recognition protein [Nannospalax galili]